MRYFQALVKATLPGVNVVWSRLQANVPYPLVSLQVIVGPLTTRIERVQAQRQTVDVTVLNGAVGDLVGVVVGGQYLTLVHTGDPLTTAEALADLAPSTWTTVVTDDQVTFSGPDVFGGIAYFGTEVTNTPVGDLLWVNCHRRDTTIQADIWTQLDRTGRPERWSTNGCDSMALTLRDRLWDSSINSPWRIVVRPSDVIRPFSESYADGREYARASFDTIVSWLDIIPEIQHGSEVGTLEEATGTIETSSDGLTYVIEDFTIDEKLDP